MKTVRGWTRDQIYTVTQTVRQKANLYRLTSDEFARYFGGRNREVLTIFGDLDTDCDGLVDVFEALLVITIWSGTQWNDKVDLLFGLFNVTNTEKLKIDELLLLGTIIVQVVSKFCGVEPEFKKYAALQSLIRSALAPGATEMSLAEFKEWVGQCEPLKKLRNFVEDHAARKEPETSITRKRKRIMSIDAFASKLYERIERLQDVLPEFADACAEYANAWGRQKRWDFLMQNLRQLIWKLQQNSTSIHTILVDLEGSMKEEELTGGTASVVDPMKHYMQERKIVELEAMRQDCLGDYAELTFLCERLLELAEPSSQLAAAEQASVELDSEAIIDMSPARVVENRKALKKLCEVMVADTQEGGCFLRRAMSVQTSKEDTTDELDIRGGLKKQKHSTGISRLHSTDTLDSTDSHDGIEAKYIKQQQEKAMESISKPVLTVISDFNPPQSHAAQMLKLQIGEEVTVLGQDGRGWWFGQKDNGREGWFPPSYVHLEPAHFTSAGD